MSGWIKLHRQILENPELMDDNNAYIMFTKLLLVTNKKTGKYTTGRFRLADLCNMNPSTARNTLERLVSYGLVDKQADNKRTVISICNWFKYQAKEDKKKDSQRTARGQQKDTKQELERELEYIDTNVSTEKISKLYYEAIKALDLPVRNHNTIRAKIRELQKHPEPERIINYLQFMRDVYLTVDIPYKPAVNDGLDIYQKRAQITQRLKSHVKDNGQGVAL